METKLFIYGLDSVDSWFNARGFKELLSKEIDYRNSLGSNESLEKWLEVLEEAYTDSIVLFIYRDKRVVGCAMLSSALSLHYDNLVSVTCMLAESNSTSLIRECIRSVKGWGYSHIELTTKKDLNTCISKVIKL